MVAFLPLCLRREHAARALKRCANKFDDAVGLILGGSAPARESMIKKSTTKIQQLLCFSLEEVFTL